MKRAKIKSGMSLPEILTSIMIVALLAALSLPAIKAVYNSFSSTGSAEAMINAALSNARAMAMSQQKYVGVRFQKEGNPENALTAPQYMIFIISDPVRSGLKYGFRAVEGIQPIKLPDNTLVLDLRLVTDYKPTVDPIFTVDVPISSNVQLNENIELTDTSSFSIIFSPQGNLVIDGAWVHGVTDTDDDVFNSKTRVDLGFGRFYEDDYFTGRTPVLGLGPERSRKYFVICEQDKFKKAYENSVVWTGYLSQLTPVFINSYTGTIISAGQ